MLGLFGKHGFSALSLSFHQGLLTSGWVHRRRPQYSGKDVQGASGRFLCLPAGWVGPVGLWLLPFLPSLRGLLFLLAVLSPVSHMPTWWWAQSWHCKCTESPMMWRRRTCVPHWDLDPKSVPWQGKIFLFRAVCYSEPFLSGHTCPPVAIPHNCPSGQPSPWPARHHWESTVWCAVSQMPRAMSRKT